MSNEMAVGGRIEVLRQATRPALMLSIRPKAFCSGWGKVFARKIEGASFNRPSSKAEFAAAVAG
jgi:hypothetical protein